MRRQAPVNRLGVVFIIFAALGLPLAARSVSVRLSPIPEFQPPAQILLVAQNSEAVDTPRRLQFQLEAGSTAQLDLPANGVWRLAVRTPEVWAEAVSVFVSADTRPVEIQLWPAGTLAGKVQLEDQDTIPVGMRIVTRFRMTPAARPNATAQEDSELAGSISCPVTPSGDWSCKLPAQELDVRLRIPGYVSQYRWGLAVPTNKTVELEPLLFKPGASVVGWVVVTEGRASESEARALLRPLAGGRFAGEAQNPNQAHDLGVNVNDRGFFHFDGVAAGSYELEVSLKGYGSVRRAPIEVLGRTEAELNEILELALPRPVEISLQPSQDPWGQPWRLHLLAMSGSGTPQDFLSESEIPEGYWQDPAVAPGQYRLMVRDSQRSLWYTELLVHGSEPTIRQVELPVVELEGELLLGDEPLAATLTFGRGPRNLTMHSDEEGRFYGYLTEFGEWKVTIQAQDPQVRQRLAVEVEEPSPGAKASTKIVLPNARLRGTVMYEDGKPAKPPTFVDVRWFDKLSGGVFVYVQEDGTFELLGLEPGWMEIGAEAPGGMASEGRLVEARETAEPEAIRLVLHRHTRLLGRVTAAGRAVVSAQILAEPIGPELPMYSDAMTDVDGWFELTLPPKTQAATLRVLAPGFALRTLRTEIVEGNPVEIEVDQNGGQLQLQLPFEQDLSDWQSDRFVLVHDGNLIDLRTLRQWAMLNGVATEAMDILVPRMASGTYHLCRMANVDVRQSHRSNWQCTEGYLPPLGELTLSLATGPEASESENTTN